MLLENIVTSFSWILNIFIFNFLFGIIKYSDVPKWNYFPGTVVHEISHLVVAKIFGLNVNDFSLFHFKDFGNELGFVQVAYNSHSLKDRLGMFLSSIAPMISISSLTYFIIFSNSTSLVEIQNNNPLNFVLFVLNPFNFGFLRWIVLILVVLFLTNGIFLSLADIKSGFQAGWIVLIPLVVILNVLNIQINTFLKIIFFSLIPIYVLNFIFSWIIFFIKRFI